MQYELAGATACFKVPAGRQLSVSRLECWTASETKPNAEGLGHPGHCVSPGANHSKPKNGWSMASQRFTRVAPDTRLRLEVRAGRPGDQANTARLLPLEVPRHLSLSRWCLTDG